MIRNVSESVIISIAGLILTFITHYELIRLIIDHNNPANFETWIFFKWVSKNFVAVMLITNTFNITRAVFDAAQHESAAPKASSAAARQRIVWCFPVCRAQWKAWRLVR